MRVLIINKSETKGGAAIAAKRLFVALSKINVDVWMLVLDSENKCSRVITPNGKINKYLNLFRGKIDKIPLGIFPRNHYYLFSLNWLNNRSLLKCIEDIKPDIIHLHWINGGTLSLSDINKINYPIVWSLHDAWPMTGGCHTFNSCTKYTNSCNNCPAFKESFKYDFSYFQFRAKKKLFHEKHIAFVALSKWMQNSAQNSSLLGEEKVYLLPNPIDTEFFKPISKEMARKQFSLTNNKRILLFGAQSATTFKIKGYHLLLEALKKLESDKYHIIIYGNDDFVELKNFNNQVTFMGKIRDNNLLMLLYNAADIMMVPSMQENLSNTIMESLACGTPVVAFNIGGNSDLIEHLENGYLAKEFDVEDFSKGIELLFNMNMEKLKNNARNSVLKKYEQVVIAKEYLKLYQELCK